LKQARIEAGMTQEQIARQLQTTKSVISRMENHATYIRLSTLEKFAKNISSGVSCRRPNGEVTGSGKFIVDWVN
jgi:transcriptional regulator with XRE-family HTH domain